MKPATCALCGAAEAYPMFGHVTPLCRTCDREWQESPERQAAARARQDFRQAVIDFDAAGHRIWQRLLPSLRGEIASPQLAVTDASPPDQLWPH